VIHNINRSISSALLVARICVLMIKNSNTMRRSCSSIKR